MSAYGPEWLFIAAGLAWSVAAGSVSPVLGVVSLLVVVYGGRVLLVGRRRELRRERLEARRREVWRRREAEAALERLLGDDRVRGWR